MKKKPKKLKKQRSLSYHIGNLIIIVSLLTFALVFYPVLATYLFPPEIRPPQVLIGTNLTIPKLNAQAVISLNTDPFNESEYKEVLKKSVAHAKGSALPGEKGSVFLFAHSSGNPIEITNYNTIFLRIGELDNGDEIILSKDGKIYKYKFREKKIVWPTETKYLSEKKDQLILQTCWPIGTSLKRLLVFADPVR